MIFCSMPKIKFSFWWKYNKNEKYESSNQFLKNSVLKKKFVYTDKKWNEYKRIFGQIQNVR